MRLEIAERQRLDREENSRIDPLLKALISHKTVHEKAISLQLLVGNKRITGNLANSLVSQLKLDGVLPQSFIAHDDHLYLHLSDAKIEDATIPAEIYRVAIAAVDAWSCSISNGPI